MGNLGVLFDSVVNYPRKTLTTQTQRTQRLRRANCSEREFQCQLELPWITDPLAQEAVEVK
jgi:hypothetical protein